MTTTASPKTALHVPSTDHLDERSRRARTEPMSVLALGNGLYEVESASDNTYLVDIEATRCTCPDHVFRSARCKHLRRVAIEITDGRTPPPGMVARPCRDCTESVFVAADETRPVYCDTHRLAAGDLARDKETDANLVVVDVSDRRADSTYLPAADCTVADYSTNDSYEPDVPVVGAIYPHARVAKHGPVPDSLQVYVFPRTRLEKSIARS